MLLFCHCNKKPLTVCISETNQPIFMGFSARCGIKMPTTAFWKNKNVMSTTSDTFCLIALHVDFHFLTINVYRTNIVHENSLLPFGKFPLKF